MDLMIYGAQGYALSVCEAIRTLYPKRKVSGFLVSAMEGNASVLGGLPVLELECYAREMTAEEKDSVEVLIATPENVQPEIEEQLENYGLRHHYRIGTEKWEEMMKLFHVRHGRFLPLSALPVGCHLPFIRIFIARSHMDTPLKHPPAFQNYMLPLQVGAENCNVRIAELSDNRGESISNRNGNYSELTGLYWIWKNKLEKIGSDDGDAKQYYGLAQYRRMFSLSEDDLLRLSDNDVDAVMPYPMPYEPDIHAHHHRYLKDGDWNAMLKALGELSPEYADALPQIFGQRYFYNYNVILARKPVLREYCRWLFPILARAEELSDPRGCERNDRYIGYLGESLETLYFMKNAEMLNIVHAGCRQYV